MAQGPGSKLIHNGCGKVGLAFGINFLILDSEKLLTDSLIILKILVMRNIRIILSLATFVTLVIPVMGLAEVSSPEHLLYAKVIEAYRQGDSLQLNKSVRLFLKTYPQSVHADNSLYLNGLLALSKENYKRASKNFRLVQKFYPNGNKIPSAMVGRGIALRKLGKNKKAMEIFEGVRKKFPGSPEYFQSDFQLKFLK